MDMNNSLVVGAGALIVGVIIGYSMSGSGAELAKEGLARTEALSAEVEEMTTKVDGLDEKVGGIETAFADFGAKQSEGLKGIGEQIAGIGGTVSGAVDKFGAGVSEAVKGQIDGLREQLSTLRAPGGGESGGGNAGGGNAGGGAEAPQAGSEGSGGGASAEASGSGTALRPGMAAVIAPDKLHVFLSSADREAGTATVAVNGQALSTVSVGQEQEANGCHFSLTGFDAKGAAMIDGGC